MILLLDTTVLIDVLRSRNDSRNRLAALVAGGHLLSTAAINVAEVYAGMRASEASATSDFLSSLECHSMTEPIARRAGSLKRELAGRGRTISLADMIVAATALEHGLTLMTSNRKDFPIAELKLHP